MNLILLAAGKSSRIYNKIKKNKCLIKINNKSLIKNIIDNSSNADISEINIITGFKPQNIKKELKNRQNVADQYTKELSETFKVDKNSNLKEIGNKIDKKNLKSVNGQFMGIVFIPKKFINLIINKYNIYSNSKLQLTQFVNKLIKDNIKIKCVNYNDFWYEIDDYEDLINYKKSKKKSLK